MVVYGGVLIGWSGNRRRACSLQTLKSLVRRCCVLCVKCNTSTDALLLDYRIRAEVLDLRAPCPTLTFPVPLDASAVTQRLRQHVPKWSSDGGSVCRHVVFPSCFTSECLRACIGLSLSFGTPESSVLLWDIRRPSAPMAAIRTPHGNVGFLLVGVCFGAAPHYVMLCFAVRRVIHATWLPESRNVFVTASLDRKISLQRLTFS